jgi:uncharacterized protein YbjT (DUF2867 family)
MLTQAPPLAQRHCRTKMKNPRRREPKRATQPPSRACSVDDYARARAKSLSRDRHRNEKTPVTGSDRGRGRERRGLGGWAPLTEPVERKMASWA